LDRSGRESQDLPRFQAGRIVEEPTAAGEHEHRVALRLEQVEGRPAILFAEAGRPMDAEERVGLLRAGAGENRQRLVARVPGLAEEFPAGRLEARRELVAKPVEGLPERRAPPLAPSRMLAGRASAVLAPAADPVSAAPGRVLGDPALVLRRMRGEVFAVVGQAGEALRFDDRE